MNQPFVSFVVPVYGVEPYLRECIESIMAQQSSWELILVDDGSPDGCPQICDEYANKDERIRVIHQRNGGVSVARNTGLDMVRGEWIWFVDGDDYIETDVLSKIETEVKKYPRCDWVQMGMKTLCDDGRIETQAINSCFDLAKKDFMLKYPSFHNHRILFKRTIVMKIRSPRFTPGLRMAEDQEFQLKYLMLCNFPIQLALSSYVYRMREGSATHAVSTYRNALYDTFIVLRHLQAFAVEHQVKQVAWLDMRLYRLTTAALLAASRIKNLDCRAIRQELNGIMAMYRNIGFRCFERKTMKIASYSLFLYFTMNSVYQWVRNKLKK